MLKNFIFDVDRTLVDSYKAELDTLKEALYIVTNTLYSDEVMNKLTQLTTKDFFNKLGIEDNSETMKKINYYWGKLLNERKILFFDGIKELLNDIKEKRYFLGIVTSRTQEELNELSELLECLDLFDEVITSEKVNFPKPNPESINIIIEKFNLIREETIYIGDSQSDCDASKNASIYFGFASWENKNRINNYDFVFKNPDDIRVFFDSKKL